MLALFVPCVNETHGVCGRTPSENANAYIRRASSRFDEVSGIVAVYHRREKPVSGNTLNEMLEALAHRGPDGSVSWAGTCVGLGHRMLCTTPESVGEVFPLESRNGGTVVTADVRIDNRDELLHLLGRGPGCAPGMGDGALVLEAYGRWGERCPEMLLGDFAFVIWDAREEKLFCARDPFGVKPFYYYCSDELFAVASEIKALLRVPGVPRRLNEMYVGDFLAGEYQDEVHTALRDIKRLPRAHAMVVGRDVVRLTRYWSLDPEREVCLGSSSAWAEAFREHFVRAVRRRMRSNASIGAMLSGGLDSSSVVCAARMVSAATSTPLHTFSAVFDGIPACNERPYIEAVLALNGTVPHFVQGIELDPLAAQSSERALRDEDVPLLAFNLSLNWHLYALAQREGVRVILDGFDGDTTVSHGVARLNELAAGGNWLKLAGALRAYAAVNGGSPAGYYAQLLRRYPPVPLAYVPRLVRTTRGRFREAIGNQNGKAEGPLVPGVRADFLRRLEMGERTRCLNEGRSGIVRSERQHHWRRLTWGVMPQTLEELDRAAAAFSVELRFPFWDRELVELCLAFPAAQKMDGGWTRMVLRNSMGGILPESIRWRPGKSDLSPYVDTTLPAFHASRIEEMLDGPGLLAEYMDVETLRRMYRSVQNGKFDGNCTSILFKAVSLYTWFHRTEIRP